MQLLFHRRTVAQPCVNGDWLSQWRMAKFDPRADPKPLNRSTKKFETVGYVRETTPCAKFRANPSIEGYSANG